jgi:uncharacterized membrane protein YtjA (UPF0391 family)
MAVAGTGQISCRSKGEVQMDLLGWAIVALVVALVAALLGFTGVARGAASIAKLLFGLFIVVAIILFIMSLV